MQLKLWETPKITERITLDHGVWLDMGYTMPVKATLEGLWEHRPENFNKVVIRGRTVETPRWQQAYGRDYYFTGMNHTALPIPEILQGFLDWANDLEEYKQFGSFNGILVNWYQDSSHYIGPHSDDVRNLVPNTPILTASIGATRTFRIRSKEDRSIVKDIEAVGKTYIVMGSTMQSHYTHEIVKSSKKIGRRVSVTLRMFK